MFVKNTDSSFFVFFFDFDVGVVYPEDPEGVVVLVVVPEGVVGELGEAGVVLVLQYFVTSELIFVQSSHIGPPHLLVPG